MSYIAAPKAPLIAIFISEFQDDDVIPTGYNLTIVCIGNKSREGDLYPFSKQPYQVRLFFRNLTIKVCGGIPSVHKKDSITCAYRIAKASGNNSGKYGCIVNNPMKCSRVSLTLHLGGKYDNLFYLVNINELLKIIMNCF